MPGSGTLNSNSIQTVKYGEKATKPSNPTKNGHNFLGWYITTDNGTTLSNALYDFNTTITSNIKLYPVFYKPISDMVYVQGATIDGAITAEGYTKSINFKSNVIQIIKNFYMSETEITQLEYELYCTYHSDLYPDSTYGDSQNHPAYYVSFFDALVYCNKRSINEGLTPYYTIDGQTNPDAWGIIPTSDYSVWCDVTCDFEADGYRLPTMAEWEYAARGGNGLSGYQYKYAGSDNIDEVAWYYNNANNKNQTVKCKKANGLGLYDMSGSVFEWCWDRDTSYGGGNTARYVAGGDWNLKAPYCVVSYRGFYKPHLYCQSYGFRVVRTAK